MISSAPAKSAPASVASVALAPLAITQTLTSLPRPAGKMIAGSCRAMGVTVKD